MLLLLSLSRPVGSDPHSAKVYSGKVWKLDFVPGTIQIVSPDHSTLNVLPKRTEVIVNKIMDGIERNNEEK